MEERVVPISSLLKWTPKQKLAWEAMQTHRYILYGGARGGGKSRFLRWALAAWLYGVYVNMGITGVRVMLACETYADLRDRQISKIKLEFPQYLGQLKETKEDGLSFVMSDEFGGGVIALRNLDDPSKYQSAEFAVIAVDELTKNLKETFDVLRGSLRWPGIEHTIFLSATNPGGIGHGWVKRLWIDRDFPKELESRAHEFAFIQSLPKDNEYLTQSYWDELNSLPEDLRRAWVEGDWSIFSGQAFPDWRTDIHVIDPTFIPPDYPKWRAVDFGFSQPFCCLWFYKDLNIGRVFVYREAYAVGLTDRDQARLIRTLTPPEEQIGITYADPAMWTTKTLAGVVTTSADEYLKEGVYLAKADNNRLSGKRKVDRMLTMMPDGKPGVLIFSNCKNLIRTMPILAYSKTNPEDVDTRQEDHAYDALRYGMTNINTEVRRDKIERKVSPMTRLKSI